MRRGRERYLSNFESVFNSNDYGFSVLFLARTPRASNFSRSSRSLHSEILYYERRRSERKIFIVTALTGRPGRKRPLSRRADLPNQLFVLVCMVGNIILMVSLCFQLLYKRVSLPAAPFSGSSFSAWSLVQ